MCHHPLKASLKNFLKRCVEAKSHDLHQFVAGLFDPDIQCATCAGVSCMLASNGTCSVQPVTKLRTHQMLQYTVSVHVGYQKTIRVKPLTQLRTCQEHQFFLLFPSNVSFSLCLYTM